MHAWYCVCVELCVPALLNAPPPKCLIIVLAKSQVTWQRAGELKWQMPPKDKIFVECLLFYRFGRSGFSISVDKTNMFLFPLLTSDLFILFVFLPLQRQVAGEVQTQPQDRAVNQIAMMLAIMGLSLSYYSAKQMTENVQAQPAP